jgi:hypothetical protein
MFELLYDHFANTYNKIILLNCIFLQPEIELNWLQMCFNAVVLHLYSNKNY